MQQPGRGAANKSGECGGAKSPKAAASSKDNLSKYTKMINMGIPIGAVHNAMLRDGLDPSTLNKGSFQPIHTRHQVQKTTGSTPKFRRTRLHWEAHGGVRSNTVWGMVKRDPDVAALKYDEDEFEHLFRSKTASRSVRYNASSSSNAGGVKVIDPKRANNGGIILARIKLSHNEIARAVDTL
jgi:hypothetical protein